MSEGPANLVRVLSLENFCANDICNDPDISGLEDARAGRLGRIAQKLYPEILGIPVDSEVAGGCQTMYDVCEDSFVILPEEAAEAARRGDNVKIPSTVPKFWELAGKDGDIGTIRIGDLAAAYLESRPDLEFLRGHFEATRDGIYLSESLIRSAAPLIPLEYVYGDASLENVGAALFETIITERIDIYELCKASGGGEACEPLRPCENLDAPIRYALAGGGESVTVSREGAQPEAFTRRRLENRCAEQFQAARNVVLQRYSRILTDVGIEGSGWSHYTTINQSEDSITATIIIVKAEVPREDIDTAISTTPHIRIDIIKPPDGTISVIIDDSEFPQAELVLRGKKGEEGITDADFEFITYAFDDLKTEVLRLKAIEDAEAAKKAETEAEKAGPVSEESPAAGEK